MTSGQGGAEPGGIRRVNQSWATKGKTQSLLAAFQDADFWNLPVRLNGGKAHADGAEWIFEGVRDGKYHVIERHSPNPSDPLRTAGLLALKLSRFRIRAEDIY